MNYLPVSEESLRQAADIIQKGGIVAFPTETVYGLGADAFNPRALAKVFKAKGRPSFDPLIIHIAAAETLEHVANLSILNKETRVKLFLLADNLWPGPLSIILPKNDIIPGIATAGLPTAAIRFPGHDAAQKLISLSTGAIAAPSANPFGSLSPTKAEHVRDGLGEKVDMILDGGPSRIGLESTVLDITDGNFKILRPGGTPIEAIEKLVGAVQIAGDSEQGAESRGQVQLSTGFASPGLLKSHYAPKTPLIALDIEEIIKKPCENNSAFLFFDGFSRNMWLESHKFPDLLVEKWIKKPETASFKVLSETGQVLEAASRLFEALHELDNRRFLRIYAQFAPLQDLGMAINDRLKRASV